MVGAAFLALALVAALALARTANADPVSGAIFTTVIDGSEVNFNIYANKQDVFLNGGPGPGAPATSAGLPDGTHVFQVTDPSGKTLLSTDIADCRQFVVTGGIITGVVAAGGCEHSTGTSIDHNATTVQLFPYLDTPNPGGVYKVWATSVANYLQGCAALGVTSGLSVVDCGSDAGVAVHGFIPSDSKTDNFKVKLNAPAQEIDTRFFDANGNAIDGLAADWTDPTGASNRKWSYYAPALYIYHEAHVEDVTVGTHLITIANQPGCTVGQVVGPDGKITFGPQTVPVRVTEGDMRSGFTMRVDVSCS